MSTYSRNTRDASRQWAWRLAVLTSILALASCGGGGGGGSSESGPTASLSVQATSAEIWNPIVLTWSSAQATTCTAGGGGWSGAKATSGRVEVEASRVGSQTFTITCSDGTKSVTASSTVTVTNPRNLCIYTVPTSTVPDSYRGSFASPAPTGRLPSTMLRMVGLKDYNPWVSDDFPVTHCLANDRHARDAYVETLNRLQALGTDAIWINNYGSWDDFRKEVWTMTNQLQVPDDTIRFVIQQAHLRGIKVYLGWQFGSVDVASGISLPMSDPSLGYIPVDQLRKMLNSWRLMLLDKAALYGAAGLDGLQVDFHAFFVGVNPPYKAEYNDFMVGLIGELRRGFAGKLTMGGAMPALDARFASLLDYYNVTTEKFWLTPQENAALDLPMLKSLYRRSIADGLANAPAGVPILFSSMVQSRRNYFQTGWKEDGFCVDAANLYTQVLSSCVQMTDTTDFSVQSMGVEALFETILEHYPDAAKGLVFDTGYWHTDSLVPQASVQTAFPNLSQSIRSKPAEAVVKHWFARP